MRTRTLLSLTLMALMIGGLALAGRTPRAAAQDSGMMHVCDSTLITLLYIAEHDYGFQPMSVDVATIDKGQFAPLFEAMMAMEGDAMMTPEPMAEGGDMMATAEPMMEGGDMMTAEPMMGTMLVPGNIEGEDPVCTALRAELEAFFYAEFTMMQ